MKSNDISDDQTNLIPTTIIDEEPELTTDVDLTQVNSKSCLSKLCIKFSKGYKSYTIIQLSTSTLTIIALTLPYILHTCGMVEGAIIFTIIGVISFYTMTLMLELIMKTNAISYLSGSIENNDIRKKVVDILEGTMPAFDLRRQKYN